jgi:prenyltransferase/squalene oxidase-like repeat protein
VNTACSELDRRRLLQLAVGSLATTGLAWAQDPLLPRHVTKAGVEAVRKGLEYLESVQSPDGSFTTTKDGGTYPIAMTGLAGMALLSSGSTSSRGPWADAITRAMRFLLKCSTSNGLLATPNQDSGRPMFGHGFSLLFLGCLYGMENDPGVREQLSRVIREAITLTARGQSALGGWMYVPGGGDEGSVTITQMQALRACHNAGFVVPGDTVAGAIAYLEKCKTKAGGIRYSFNSGDSTQLPITAAAVATLYNAGEYESELAESCLAYVFKHFADLRRLDVPGAAGHTFYAHLYASQAFYQAGEKYWGNYFPRASKLLLKEQREDGAWVGDGVGPVYGTAIALIILQMPFKLLPIYQR